MNFVQKAAFFISVWIFSANLAVAADYHVVYDIDWTIVSPVEDGVSYPVDDWRWVKAQGKIYRVSDRVGEEVLQLLKNPKIKVSFMSGGTKMRNLELLRNIKPPELGGRSLAEISHKIVSMEEIPEVNPSAKSFSTRYQKQLTLISDKPKNVLLIEDSKGFIKGIDNRGIWLGKTYQHFETYEEALRARKNSSSVYIPGSRAEWLRDRNRLGGIADIVEESIQAAERGEGNFQSMAIRRFQERAKRLRTTPNCLLQTLINFS